MKTVAEIQDAVSKLLENEQGELFRWLEIHLGMREMVEQVIRLTQCYEIWWEIVNRENAKRYAEVKREYRDFFEPVTHILLWQGFFTICYQLFDERQDSKHIKLRLDQVAQINAQLADEIRGKINNYRVLSKIKTIRHKISGHRDKNRTPQQVTEDERLTANEVKEVLLFVQDIVSTLVEALGGEEKSAVMLQVSACENSAHDSAFRVMQTLTKSLRDVSGAELTLGDEKG